MDKRIPDSYVLFEINNWKKTVNKRIMEIEKMSWNRECMIDVILSRPALLDSADISCFLAVKLLFFFKEAEPQKQKNHYHCQKISTSISY